MTNQSIVFIRRHSMIVALLLTSAVACFAQQQPGPPQIDRHTNPHRERQQKMSQREWNLRNPMGSPDAPPDRKKLEALMAQTEEDFTRILVRHNEIVRAVTTTKALDYKFVSAATAEINKRSHRLQSTLALGETEAPTTESPTRDESSEEEMRSSLRSLCKLIKSFVTNPVIETPGTVNVEHLKNAQLDLGKIVKLSSQISESAVKLEKH